MVGRVTNEPGAPRMVPGVPYSQAVFGSGVCFLSGQIACDPSTGDFQGGSAAEQATLALSNLFAVMRVAGFDRDELAYVTVLLADIDDWPAVNVAYREAFGDGPYPARMAYAVGALALGALVEVQGVALRDAP
jgi:2-iminobutanoate/2-iminopropanoate deaminase